MADLPLLLATSVIAVLVVAYTFQPLLKRTGGRPRPEPGEQDSADERRRDGLFARRDALLVAIDELELDHATGKIEAGVYQSMRQRLVDQAVEALKQIDDAFAARSAPPRTVISAGGPDLSAEIERRIAGVRRGLNDGPARPAPGLARSRWLVAGTLVGLLFATAVLVTTQRVREATGRPAVLGTVAPAAAASLTIDTGDPRILYYGYTGGVRISRDGGRTWEPSPSAPAGITTLSVAGGRQRVVLAAAQTGIYASRDQGRGWERVETDPTSEPRVLAVSASEPDLVYLVAADGALLRSSDAGLSWTAAAAKTPPNMSDLAVVDALTLYASTDGDGVFVTVDGGKTWDRANGFVSGLLPTLEVRSVAYDRNSGDSSVSPEGVQFTGALYIATDQGVFRSRDGAVAWEPLPLRAPTVAVAVDPQDARIIYAVDGQGNVYKSGDRGVTWRAS